MPENYFDKQVAEHYDQSEAEMFASAAIEPAADFLAALAGPGPVLELGIGTGRIALPLRERGIQVHGIDLSPEMVEQLRSKPGGNEIEVTVGDFATASVGRQFPLAYLVFNTIMNLTSLDDQVACFRNVAAHLVVGGRFVIEVGVPGLRRLPPGERFQVFTVSESQLGFDEFDVAEQGLISHHYSVIDGQLQLQSIPFRYVWPSELDLMARLAGMKLSERWSSWQRDPFTNESVKHVSVWEKVAPGFGG